MYADIELDRGNLEGAKTIFSQCLLSCMNVDLWRSYLRYINIVRGRRAQRCTLHIARSSQLRVQTNEQRGDEGALEVLRAYEFSLERIGWASAAGSLWVEFLAFLAAVRVGSTRFTLLFQSTAGQEQSARAARLRTHYQRALQVGW